METEPPRLRAQTARLVRLSAAAGALVSWLEAVLAAITIVGMAMLPEEFPVVLAVFMAMGAWRISRARVLTRRAAAIETLGSAPVHRQDRHAHRKPHVDRRITARKRQQLRPVRSFVRPPAGGCPGHGPLRPLGQRSRTVRSDGHSFHDLAKRITGGVAAPHAGWMLAHSYGLRSGLLAVTHVWQAGAGKPTFTVAAKGAPETIAELYRLGETDRATVREEVDAMAAEGLRVLGVAKAAHEGESFPDAPHGFAFAFLGLVGLADPLRPSVPQAIGECRSAGIRVVMITGDYPATARAIAQRAGLDDGSAIIGGEMMAKLGDDDLREHARTATVFARIMPEQKLRIVQALRPTTRSLR